MNEREHAFRDRLKDGAMGVLPAGISKSPLHARLAVASKLVEERCELGLMSSFSAAYPRASP